MRQVSIGAVNLWRVLLQVCVLFSAVAPCQVLSDLASANSTTKNTVSGTVVNAITGEPIRRALVQLNESGEHLAFTDTSGQFQFDDLPPGQGTVVVRKPGFFSKEELSQGRVGPTFVTIGQDSSSVSLKLFPQGVIYGHVKNLGGEPLERVQVKAIMARIIEGRKRWQIAGSASTNEDGEFRVAHLFPGRYYIEAESGDRRRSRSDRGEGYAASFYPGAPDMSSATPFEIRVGQEADIELSLHPVRLYTISGAIAGYPQNTGVQIMFLDHLGNSFYSLKRFDQQSGQFEAEVAAGQYTLQALAWMPGGKQLRAETPLNVNRDVADISLALGATHPTPIVVKTDNRKPKGQGDSKNQDLSNLVNVRLIPLGDSLIAQEYGSVMQGNPKPSLVLPDVAPGTYSVEFQPSGSWYVQSGECGSTDLLREPLMVSAGMPVPPIEVVLRNDGATLKGHVRKRSNQTSGGAGGVVVMMPEHGLSNQTRTANVEPDGSFVVPNLAPGTYSVLALDRSDSVEYANRDALASYVSRSTSITLSPNRETQIALEPITVAN